MRIFVCLGLLPLAILIGSCERLADPPKARASDTPAQSKIAVTEAPLGREALLLAVAHAASDAARGHTSAAGKDELDGRLFELRLRFGCGNDLAADELRIAQYNEAKRVLRLRVVPDVDSDSPMVKAIVPGAFEDIEGFWVRRPWLLQPACPIPTAAIETIRDGPEVTAKAPPPPATPPSAPAWQIGVAQFFNATDARTHRRDRRAYEVVKVLGKGQQPSASGYELVIEGRLRALPDGRVIACHAQHSAVPPSCIVSAQFTQVSLERADTAEILGEWPSG